MTGVTGNEVRTFITQYLNEKLQEQGQDLLQEVSDDYDISSSGIVDSLGFAELISAASEHFGREIDLYGLDPERMFRVGPLCAYVSRECSPS